MSLHYGQTNLIIPELDNDPAILKIIHDGERLERETCRRELMQILKIQPLTTTSDLDRSISQTTNSSVNQESIQTSPSSITENDPTSQIRTKQPIPTTPSSSSNHQQHHQRSLNSSGISSANRSSIESPTSRKSFMKQTKPDSNLASSPISMKHKANHNSNTDSNVLLTASGVLVTDYRQSKTMKRIVNPQWNIIPFI